MIILYRLETKLSWVKKYMSNAQALSLLEYCMSAVMIGADNNKHDGLGSATGNPGSSAAHAHSGLP
jgi:hypothetical protein